MKSPLFAALFLVSLSQGAGAAERPDAENMGKLLAYTVNCGCVVGEQDWILGVYRELFADAYGETYADALQAPLQGALKDGWDRNMSLCKRICDQPVVHELQQSLARADDGTVDGSAIRSELGPAPEDAPVSAEAAPALAEAVAPEVDAVVGDEPTVTPQAAPEEAGAVAAAPAADAAVPQAEQSPEPEIPAAVVSEPSGTAASEAVDEAEVDSGPPDLSALFATSGSNYVASSAYCRTSPTRPTCRRVGAE